MTDVSQRTLNRGATEPPKPASWLIVLIFTLVLLPRVLNLDVFLAHDETLFWEWSHQFFFSLLTGDLAGTIVGPGNPSIIPMWAQTLIMAAQYGWAWLFYQPAEALVTWPAFEPRMPFTELTIRRLPIALINTLSITTCWWFCHRLFGRYLALIAAALLIFDPFVLADSRTGRGEGLLAGFVTVALLSFIYFWHSRQRRYLLISGCVMGLALLTKMSALSLVPTVGFISLGYLWAESGRFVFGAQLSSSGSHAATTKGSAGAEARPAHFVPSTGLTWTSLKRALVILAAWFGLALAVFWALWPAMWVAPLEALTFLWGFAHNVGLEGRTNYFWGQLYQAEFLPLYYLVVFILRVTPATLLGLVAFGCLLGGVWITRRRTGLAWPAAWEEAARHTVSPPILGVALFALVFGTFMTVGVLKRDWYLLPAFPALDIVAAAGLLWAAEFLRRRFYGSLSAPKTALAVAAVALLLQAGVSLPAHPLYYTYWNPLVLGGRWAAQAVMVGWDIDLSMGAHYLNTKPDAAGLQVATRSPRGFQNIFKGNTILLANGSNWVQADYILVRQTHLQLHKHEAGELNYLTGLNLDHIIHIGGVDYLWIYQGPAAQHYAGSKLDGLGILLGYNLDLDSVAAGNSLKLKLFWQNDGRSPDDLFFVRLVDAGGYVWAETLPQPLPGYEQAALTDAEFLESQADLPVPPGTPPGLYFLSIGFRSARQGEILGLFQLPAGADKLTVTRPATPALAANLSLPHRLHQPVAPNLLLLGYNLPDNLLTQTGLNWLTLFWQAGPTLTQDYALGLQLLNPQGEEVAYWLGRPVFSGYPTSQWTPAELVRDPWQLELPANVSPGPHTLQLTVYNAATQTPAGQTHLGQVTVTDRRRQFTPPAMAHPVNARLGQAIALLGYDLASKPLTGGGRLELTLYWQAQQPVPVDYTVFVHLINAEGQLVAQHDGGPVNGTIPTTTWQAGEIIPDPHRLEFMALPPGQYRLLAGLYHPATGERLPVSGGDTAVLLQTMVLN